MLWLGFIFFYVCFVLFTSSVFQYHLLKMVSSRLTPMQLCLEWNICLSVGLWRAVGVLFLCCYMDVLLLSAAVAVPGSHFMWTVESISDSSKKGCWDLIGTAVSLFICLEIIEMLRSLGLPTGRNCIYPTVQASLSLSSVHSFQYGRLVHFSRLILTGNSHLGCYFIFDWVLF